MFYMFDTSDDGASQDSESTQAATQGTGAQATPNTVVDSQEEDDAGLGSQATPNPVAGSQEEDGAGPGAQATPDTVAASHEGDDAGPGAQATQPATPETDLGSQEEGSQEEGSQEETTAQADVSIFLCGSTSLYPDDVIKMCLGASGEILYKRVTVKAGWTFATAIKEIAAVLGMDCGGELWSCEFLVESVLPQDDVTHVGDLKAGVHYVYVRNVGAGGV